MKDIFKMDKRRRETILKFWNKTLSVLTPLSLPSASLTTNSVPKGRKCFSRVSALTWLLLGLGECKLSPSLSLSLCLCLCVCVCVCVCVCFFFYKVPIFTNFRERERQREKEREMIIFVGATTARLKHQR